MERDELLVLWRREGHILRLHLAEEVVPEIIVVAEVVPNILEIFDLIQAD